MKIMNYKKLLQVLKTCFQMFPIKKHVFVIKAFFGNKITSLLLTSKKLQDSRPLRLAGNLTCTANIGYFVDVDFLIKFRIILLYN